MKYISNILSTGAVRETPEKVIKKILVEINKAHSRVIEFGAGKGEITHPILRHFGTKDISYYAFEIDKKFSSVLRHSSPNIHVISDDAFAFEKSLPFDFRADYIISSMPLSFYAKTDLTLFLEKVCGHLTENGKLLILFHAFWMIPFFKKQLFPVEIHRFNTLPPYFLLVFKKKNEKLIYK